MMMKKNIGLLLMALAMLSMPVYAQLASNKQVSRDSLMNYLNVLLKDNSATAREQLLKEAGALRKNNSEEDLSLAVKIYTVVDDTATAALLEKQIIKNYPRGLVARDAEYFKIFNKEKKQTIGQKEIAYQKWIKQFPSPNFTDKQQGKYNFALMDLVEQFAAGNNLKKATFYLNQLKDTSIRTVTLYNFGSKLLDLKKEATAKPYLRESLALSAAAKSSGNSATKNSFGALFYENILNAYTRILLAQGAKDSVVTLLRPLMKESQFGGMNAAPFTFTMAKALNQSGENKEAFTLLNTFLVSNPPSEEGMKIMETVYPSLHATTTLTDYKKELAKSQNAFLQNKLTSQLIKEKAADFSMLDMQGKKVQLSDFAGKVVVVDFWATWCIPCLKSFPAMRQLIKHFEQNKKVAFLFVNTWENNPDYRNSVRDLMQKNNYPFNVVYDDKEQGQPQELVAKKFGVASLPTKCVLDQNGNIRFRISGVDASGWPEEKILEAMIELLLGGA